MAHGEFDSKYHAPALAAEVVELLADARSVLDGTVGGGGHSAALLSAGVAHVAGIDRDDDALAETRARIAALGFGDRFEAYKGNYADVALIAELKGKKFDGILLDLGISSHQVDDSSRGFSFRVGLPLDMRMDRSAERDGRAVLNDSSLEELTNIFRDYGDEPHAPRIAREVVRRREQRPFETSDDLVGAIRAALGARSGAPEFARLFQAVRIAVNNELSGLERALPDLRDRLIPGGVFAIVAYHSGEDRLVKHAFREWSTACICPPKHPVCTCGGDHALGEVLTRRAIVAKPAEVQQNPRARSAKLRAWRRAR